MSKKAHMKPIVDFGLSNDKYHANREFYNSSRIKIAKRSLAHLKYEDDNYDPYEPEVKKEHFELGAAFEIMLTDRKNAEQLIAVTNEEEWIAEALKENPKLKEPKRSKVYSDNKIQFYEDNGHKVIITPEQVDIIEQMVLNVYKSKSATTLLDVPHKYKQMSLFWQDPNTGLKLKTRPDVYNPKFDSIIEIKTIDDASPSKVAKQCANLDYFLQAALQIKGIQEAKGKEVKMFYWLFVEKEPPYLATLYEFQKDDIEYCMQMLNHHIEQIAEAVKTGKWSGYEVHADNTLGIVNVEMPLYYNR